MADYSSLKVPELKKLLSEKKLPQTGNKADLIARLQEEDKKNAGEEQTSDEKPAEAKEDEINYSDDEAAKPEPKTEEKPAEKPAVEEAATEPAAESTEEKPADEASEQPAEKVEEKPAPSFAIGLNSTTAEEELKKRADRAKRFGLELDDETQKLAERAKRFGINDDDVSTGLDSALPERPLKRGRGRNEGEGNRPGKRQSRDRRGGGGGERRSARNRGKEGGNTASQGSSGILTDPAEKAKAEKRAARFAAA